MGFRDGQKVIIDLEDITGFVKGEPAPDGRLFVRDELGEDWLLDPAMLSPVSHGHVFVVAGWEYFEVADQIFKAHITNGMEHLGTHRIGPTWVCSRAGLPDLIRTLRDKHPNAPSLPLP